MLPNNTSIVAVALGTRGDVQPVALLTAQLLQHLTISQPPSSCGAVSITLITHAAHTSWLEQQQLVSSGAAAGGDARVQLRCVSSLPAAVWHGETNASVSIHRDSMAAEDLTRTELLQQCCTALQLPLPAPAAAAAVTAGTQQQQQPHQPQQQGTNGRHHHHQQQQDEANRHHGQQRHHHRRLLLFNLFALEAYSIAEALQVPCCVVQPYLVPYSMPSGFERRFQAAAPGLYAQLKAAADRGACTTPATAPATAPGAAAAAGSATAAAGATCAGAAATGASWLAHTRVTWNDVAHWMWPLFTQRWGAWRQEVLGLQPWPLVEAVQQHWQGCTFAAAAASAATAAVCDNRTTEAPATAAAPAAAAGERGNAGATKQAAAVAAEAEAGVKAASAKPTSSTQQDPLHIMPCAVPVLYGLDPAIVTRPGFWPSSLHLCGFWLVEQFHHQRQQQSLSIQPTLPQQLQQSQQKVGQQQQQQDAGVQLPCQLPEALQCFLSEHGLLQSTAAMQQHVAAHAGPQSHKHKQQQQQQKQQAGRDGQQQQQQQQRCLLVVDFGSMGALGLLRDASTVLMVLLQALALLGPGQWACVLLTGGWAPLLEAHQLLLQPPPHNGGSSDGGSHGSDGPSASTSMGMQQPQQHQQQQTTLEFQQQQQLDLQLQAALPALFLQHEPLTCHHLLLEAASVVLHHGGSGTTAAALAAGTPQLVCPLQFDQFNWAEQVVDLGCSPAQLSSSKLLLSTGGQDAAQPTAAAASGIQAAGAYLAAQVLAAQQPGVVAACQALKQELARSQGVKAAASHIQGYLQAVYSPLHAAPP